MARMKLTPCRGMNNVDEDDALQLRDEHGSAGVFVRDAVNVDVTPRGKMLMRGSVRKVTDVQISHLWRSTLSGEVFGVAGGQWGRVDLRDWSLEPMIPWHGEWASHCQLGAEVAVAGVDGIFTWDGKGVRRLTIDTPPAPMLMPEAGGTLQGRIAVGVSWLRGRKESSVSLRAECDADGGVRVILPQPMDASVTGVRVYASTPGGSDWLLMGEYPASTADVKLTGRHGALSQAPFVHKDAMPSGRWMRLWNGRLLVAGLKSLHFSEPMAWHLHDRRTGTVMFPQRVTFIAPVAGGVWVGQRDHVVFLDGMNPDQWQLRRMAGQPPVLGSAAYLSAQDAGEMGGGQDAAIWLAGNGYVIGTASGQMFETAAGKLQRVGGVRGESVVWGERVLTLVA